MSAEAASTALAMIAFIFSGSASYLVLLNMISNCSAFWWKLCSMHTLETSGNPSSRSDEALLNSAPSRSPRSTAGQRVHRRPHAGEQIDRDADGPELETLEIVDLGDRLFIPAERLRRVRSIGERNHVRADGRIQLV